MYNLLFIIGSIGGIGGEQRSIAMLCNELMKYENYKITIISIESKQLEYPLDDCVRIIYLKTNTSWPIAKILFQIKCLFKAIRQSDYHLVIGYGAYVRFVTGVLDSLLKTPVVFCERRDPSANDGFDIWRKILRTAGVSLLRRKTVIFQTEALVRHYKNLKRYTVIPNLLDVSSLPNANDWSQRENSVVTAARFVIKKNLPLLINAFIEAHASFPHYKLTIFGEGDLEQELIDLIIKKKAESYITIKPSTPEIFARMNNAKIYVCSSNEEGYPNSLLEAMAMGMACISTNYASAKYVIDDGASGLLVPVNDIDSMAEALKKLMEDDIMAQELAANAINVRQTNAKEKVIDKWITFFSSVIEDNARDKLGNKL